jgi:hypothetical protein
LSRQLVPESFFDDLRRPPAAAGAGAVAVSAIPEEKKAELIEKLRQRISDEEDCSVSKLHSRERAIYVRFATMLR